MYHRDNFDDYNEEINTDNRDDHDDYYYDEFLKMPYYREQIPYLPQMYYPMMYSYPMLWNMQKRDEEGVEDLDLTSYDNDYRCKECDHDHDHDHNHDHNHDHDHYHNCKYCKNYGYCMPMMNMPMYENQIPVSDEDLKCMYPKIYIRIYPMVKYHCDMMESKYGAMYCPSKDEMDNMCKEVCDKCEEQYESYDENNRDDDEEMRQRRREDRRGGIQDLTRILFIGNLLGRRKRRRRRRRMFHNGY